MRFLPRSAKSTLLMSQFRGVAVVDILLLWRSMRGKYLDDLVAGRPVQCPVLRQEYTNFKEWVRYFRCSVGLVFRPPPDGTLVSPKIADVIRAQPFFRRSEGSCVQRVVSPHVPTKDARKAYLRTTCPTGSRNPASLASFAALSVDSQVKSAS